MRPRRVVQLALATALVLASLGFAGSASAAAPKGTIKLDPPTAQADNGGTVSIKVVATSPVAISGLSASITFDKNVLQVTSITRGAAWASAPLFIAADAKAISTANQKGVLQSVAASFFPPGTVPAGTQDFITVEFKATACGTVAMTMPTGRVDSAMLDGRASTYGNAVKVTTTGATVTVCQGGAGASVDPGASGSLDPNASVDPNASPDPNASVDPNASTDPNASASPTPSASGQAAAGVQPASSAGTGGGAGTTGAADGAALTSEQSGWMTFAMASLAVAAAGLAALILVLVFVALVAAAVGTIVVMRYWRRSAARDKGADAVASTATDDPAATKDGDKGDADESAGSSGAPARLGAPAGAALATGALPPAAAQS